MSASATGSTGNPYIYGDNYDHDGLVDDLLLPEDTQLEDQQETQMTT